MAKNTRPMRAELPVPVWDRFAAEAAAHGKTPGTYLRELIVSRDERKQKKQVSGNTQ